MSILSYTLILYYDVVIQHTEEEVNKKLNQRYIHMISVAFCVLYIHVCMCPNLCVFCVYTC